MLLLFQILYMFSMTASSPATQSIYKKLFENYNKNLRPVRSSATVTSVTLNPVLHTLQNVDELHEILTFNQWMHMTWNDQFLVWNPEKFEGEENIEVPSKLIWTPDIYIQGMINREETPTAADTFCDINYKGIIHCQFNQIVRVHCDFNIMLFPFDLQNCSLRYGSWVYNAKQVDLVTESTNGTVTFYKDNTEWWLLSYTNERQFTNYTQGSAFVDIIYSIAILRKPMYYILTLLLPSFVITTLALIGLFSPFSHKGERQEKVTMGLTTLLTMAVLLLVISQQMPKTSKGLPLIGIYILFEIIIASVGTCVTVVVMRLHMGATNGEPIPYWLICLTRVDSKYGRQGRKVLAKENGAIKQGNRNWSSKSDTRKTSKPELATILLEHVLNNLIEIKQYADQKEKDNRMAQAWGKACDRWDIMMTAFFNIVNILVTFVVLRIAYWIR